MKTYSGQDKKKVVVNMGYRLAKGHLYKDFSKDIFWEEL